MSATPLFQWGDGKRSRQHSPAPLRDGLRPFQVEAVDAILAALKTGRSTALDLATGLGKTTIACSVAHEWPTGRVLFLAHRRELIDQMAKRLEHMGEWLHIGDQIGIELGQEVSSARNHFVVASNASIFRPKRLARLKAEGGFGLIIIDEGHRAGEKTKTYTNILAAFPEAKVLGLSATLDRLDEAALPYDGTAYRMDIRAGIQEGWLVPIRARTIHVREVDLDNVAVSKTQDLAVGDLDREMAKGIVSVAQRLAQVPAHQQGIVFLPGVQSAELCAAMLRELTGRPDAAICITGTTPVDERDRLLRAFKAGEYQWFCNVNVATEGFDAPAVSVIANAAPTTSRARYCQRVGRGTRPIADLSRHRTSAARRKAISASRKPAMELLNFTANCTKHSLVGPAHLIGGSYDHRVLSIVERQAKDAEADGGDPPELLDAMEAAAREVEAADLRAEEQRIRERQRREMAKAALNAKVRKIEEAYDPFKLAKLIGEGQVVPRRGKLYDDAAEIGRLRTLGFTEAHIRKYGIAKLSQWVEDQRRNGWLTYRQYRQLRRFGYNDRTMSYSCAKAALNYIASCGFSTSAVNNAELHRIIQGGAT